jgi:phosphoglucomutase
MGHFYQIFGNIETTGTLFTNADRQAAYKKLRYSVMEYDETATVKDWIQSMAGGFTSTAAAANLVVAHNSPYFCVYS